MCVTCGCGSDMSHEEMHKHGIAIIITMKSLRWK